MEKPGERYKIQQSRDKSWGIIDTHVDEEKQERRVVKGLSEQEALDIAEKLNEASVA